MYSFLENFHQRMEQVAIHHFISDISGLKDVLRSTDLSRAQVVNIVMELLCFIMEKSLLEQSCTIEDMSAFMGYILVEQKIEVDDETAFDITRYLVRDALQNGGKPYYFESFDFNKGQNVIFHVRLIEDRLMEKEGQEYFSYSLTAQGYQFLFSTLEVEEALQMSFEQLRLKYAIQKRNFGSAKESVDNLFTLNRKQIQKIREYIRQIKEDIGQFTSEDYEETYRSTFETLDEQRTKHEELHQLIIRTQEQYMEQQMSHDDLTLNDDLGHIDYIRVRLQQLLGEQLKLFHERQTLSEVYDEAISNVLYIGFENRMDIEKDLVEVFEGNPASFEAMAAVLRPLMKPNVERRFNPSRAYGMQKIEAYDEDAMDLEQVLEEVVDEEAEKMRSERLEYIQTAYESIVNTILTGIRNDMGQSVRLSMLFTDFDEVQLLRNVLIQFHNDNDLNIKAVLKESEEHVYTPSEDFDLAYTLSRIHRKRKELKGIKHLRTAVIKEKKITILSERDRQYLRCCDMLFEGRKEKV